MEYIQLYHWRLCSQLTQATTALKTPLIASGVLSDQSPATNNLSGVITRGCMHGG